MVSLKAERISAVVKKTLLLVLTVCSVNVGFSNPTGGSVTNGNATITRNGNTTTIQQNSKQTVIEWKTFNIGKNEATRFQQVAGGIALNRIDSNQGMSQIFGILSATGKIILINPAGIYFGAGSVISVGGMIASTSNITNANFLAGRYIFDQPSRIPGASIINEGSIRASDYGLIALIGNTVTNHGLIQAELGNIVLATGNKFTFDFYGDQLINFSVDAPVADGGKITNTGSLLADGGKIVVSAQVAQGVLDNVIDMEGVAQARSVAQHDGQIILMANNGEIKVGGQLNTDSRDNGTRAGNITITAPRVTITSTGLLSAIGSKQGGTVNITTNEAKIAGKILAVGVGNGALGGNVTVIASNMDFSHAIVNASGNGGGGNINLAAPVSADASHAYINVDRSTSILADALVQGNGGTISLATATTLIDGKLSAAGLAVGTAGGAIRVLANEIHVAQHAKLSVQGDIGGGNVVLANTVQQTATINPYINVDAGSSILADAMGSGKGGNISISSDQVTVAGTLSATGAVAGTFGGGIQVLANEIQIASTAVLTVRGDIGGGNVVLASTTQQTATINPYINIDAGSSILADAMGSGKGGNISVSSDQVTVAGTLSATGAVAGTFGGGIQILANEIQIAPNAVLTVRGDIGGGSVVLAGKADAHGNLTNATYINVSALSTIVADAVNSGTAGNISLYGDKVDMGGTLSAAGSGTGTVGGTIGIYGKDIAVLSGAFVNASAQFAGGLIIIGTNPHSTSNDTASSSVTIALGSQISAAVLGQVGLGGTIQVASNNTKIAGKLDVSGKNTGSSGGTIQLTGANIEIQAAANLDASGYQSGGQIVAGNAASNIVSSVNVDQGSELNAQGLGTHATGGLIQLYATNTNVLGTLNVSAVNTGGRGGSVKVLAHDNLTLGNTANILAMGDAAGGVVTVGGDAHGAGSDTNAQYTTIASGSVINASALTNGTGGNVVVWSDINTSFAGTIKANGGIYSGNGGQVEVSSAKALAYSGKTDLRASQGATGTLTLDPQNLTIQTTQGGDSNNSVITVATLEDALATANVLIVTGKNGSAPGDITVANNIAWDNNNKLTLSAYRDINVNATITNHAGGSLELNADNTRDGVGTIAFNNAGHVTMTGGGAVVLNYEPANGNFRNPNTYAQNVTVGGGTTVAYNALNTVTPANNEAIISNSFVLPNILLNMSLASLQDDVDVIIPADNNVIVAMDNNLETITETAPGLAIKVMDNQESSTCNKASCVSNDFVIE